MLVVWKGRGGPFLGMAILGFLGTIIFTITHKNPWIHDHQFGIAATIALILAMIVQFSATKPSVWDHSIYFIPLPVWSAILVLFTAGAWMNGTEIVRLLDDAEGLVAEDLPPPTKRQKPIEREEHRQPSYPETEESQSQESADKPPVEVPDSNAIEPAPPSNQADGAEETTTAEESARELPQAEQTPSVKEMPNSGQVETQTKNTPADPNDFRVWTDKKGRVMTARFEGTEEENGKIFVKFSKEDGKTYRFPADNLSAKDLLLISAWQHRSR